MTNLSHVVQDERTARIALSMIVEPDDAVTGRLLGELGALELFRLAEGLFGRPLGIRERWQGVYASAPDDFLVATPAEGVRVVAVTTGIGMTTGLGLAERVVADLVGRSTGPSTITSTGARA